jgi:hypothetical protein
MRGRDQPHFEAERQQLPPPMMCRRARFHRHHTPRKLGEKADKPAACELARRAYGVARARHAVLQFTRAAPPRMTSRDSTGHPRRGSFDYSAVMHRNRSMRSVRSACSRANIGCSSARISRKLTTAACRNRVSFFRSPIGRNGTGVAEETDTACWRSS